MFSDASLTKYAFREMCVRCQSGNDKAVPTSMLVVQQRVDGVTAQYGHGAVSDVAKGQLVVYLRLTFVRGEDVFIMEFDVIRKKASIRSYYFDVHRFCYFPRFNQQSNALTKENHPAGVFIIIHKVQENNHLHDAVGNNGANR